MLNSQTQPDEFTFPFILKSCSSLTNKPIALESHSRLVRLGFQWDVYSSTALIDVYAKLGCIDDARKVFDKMSERNAVCWNAMTAGYAYNGLDLEAIAIFREMLEMDFEPGVSTMAAVLPACARLHALDHGRCVHGLVVRRKLSYDSTVYNCLIDMYAKCGKLGMARQLFDEIMEKTDVSWTCMISGYVHCGMMDEASILFREMQELGFKHSYATMACMLDACAELADLRLGSCIHGHAAKHGFDIDVITGTALIDMYAKCGFIEEARRVFDEMPDRNVITHNAMIFGYGIHGHGTEALETFKNMREDGVKPNSSTFVSVLSACSHAGLVNEGKQYFESMVTLHGMTYEAKHYACKVDMLGRAGFVREAFELIKGMPIEPDDVVWGALLGACRMHGHVKLGRMAAERVLELKPEEAGYYVLVANMYAAEGKWGESLRLREMMRERNMKKEAGCSSIEDGGLVHSFVVGDFRHPEWGEIHEKMGEMSEKLRCEGYVPDTSFVLHEVEEGVKGERLSLHSERIALAYGLIKKGKGVLIRITKNLRVCGDCHNVFKLVSKIYGRDIIVRDSNRFHRFERGLCSCKDYW
ncbi:pentatricopeptide repeat-containing protein At3g26782, mitochondrial-like [Amborella trichopoda]|uniref:pentatricopeptide repeat-containing protein At3g26782, mitochondrial-like n=1 Tax=Amborella trichopoda TaxID=13333 RepID=UPI0005D3EC91|nr:pentatricopeptide repeat-containing protein At3g26782, mitochondrial-like [Amborella trichopoda]|eukprot:XP_011627313.1 pentatricopeptide repeat-containing protein At3g26782, mitochondrial-like [Amborella trichopoda]